MNAPTIALQLYTVRDFAEKDLAATLSQVKEMGYDAVELAGTYGLEITAFKKLLDEAGLTAISAHVPIEGFDDIGKPDIADYKALGCKVISIPWLSMDALPGGSGYDKTKATLIRAYEACKKEGIILAYHNHDFEFKTMPCGSTILDVLLDEGTFLQAQLDTGWITAAGLAPVSYIKKYQGRCPSVHLKDIVKVNGKFEDRPVGDGMQDIPAVIEAALEAGAFILVAELDEAVGMTSLEAAWQSRKYLKSIGY